MQSTPRMRVAEICLALPEAERSETHSGPHDAYTVRGKKFAYYLNDHHGDGRIAINVRCIAGEAGRLVAESPLRFFVPAYVGVHGWVGLRIDLGETDWTEVERLVMDSYLLQAPKKLALQVARGSAI